MHFHPFGIPVDEFVVVAVNAANVPMAFYLGWARRTLASIRSMVRR